MARSIGNSTHELISRRGVAIRVGSALGLVALLASIAAAGPPDGRQAFFEERIRPILAAHCQTCHGSGKQEGGLRVDWRGGLLRGGSNGPAIEPGKPDESLLVSVVAHDEPGMEMPKGAKRLSDRVLADLRRWIAEGAFDPREREPSAEESARVAWEATLAERRDWWSLRPPVAPPIPTPRHREWARGPVDQFVLARLEAEGLEPAPEAARTTLARRLAFVLTGLPLPLEDLERYLGDPSPDALECLVDRLLSSPHAGERLARRWMDVVRYGDTYGYEWDIPAKGAWRYRDYLTRAYNADVPFDQLVREQIAGDLLPDPRIDVSEGVNASLIGPMFFQLGEKRHGDSAEFDGIHQEMLHNKIDAFSKAFQAVTLGCARCHDHKLDPISQRDYYALAGILLSPRWVSRTLDLPSRNRATLAELRALKRPLREAVGAWWLEASRKWANSLLEARPDTKAEQAWSRALGEAGADPAWDNPLRVWVKFGAGGGKRLAETWSRLVEERARTSRERSESNARDFVVVADFSKGVPRGWHVEGVGLNDGPARPGDFTLALEGPAVVGSILRGGLFTHVLSTRLNGAVRSPFLRTLERPWLSLETCGGDFAAERTIVDNAFLTERQTYLARGTPAWSTLAPLPEFQGRRVARELATKTSNPNFPPRVGLGGPCSEAQAAESKSWFGVTRAVVSAKQGQPADELTWWSTLLEGSPPSTLEQAADRHAAWWRQAVERWVADRCGEDDARILDWLLQKGLLPNRIDATAPRAVRELVDRYRLVEKRLLDPQTVNGMLDQEPGDDYRLNIRGDYDKLGPAVPRGYLEVLSSGSNTNAGTERPRDRLAIAERVASAENPLTARVYVNRIWQWVFGTGLVATPDDFGHIGERPSHPELLDFLTVRFVESGWSTRAILRELVLSATFRQGSTASPRALEIDPSDRLLHHYPLRRLEAEEVRDAILAASGRLDRRLYGPPVDPPRAKEDPQKRLFSGPLDGLGRRSLYTKLTIMEPPRFLATFNQPAPKIPAGRRDVTNVPAQALTLMNDPFVVNEAKRWGGRVAIDSTSTIDQRLDAMIRSALGRPSDPAELTRWKTTMEALARSRGVAPAEIVASDSLWADVAHMLYNSKEFLFLR